VRGRGRGVSDRLMASGKGRTRPGRRRRKPDPKPGLPCLRQGCTVPGNPLPGPCLPRKGHGTRAARSHPRNMSVNRGTACPRSCSRYLHVPCALRRLRLVLPVRPVPGLAPAARLSAALPRTALGCRAWPVPVPADGAAPPGIRGVVRSVPSGKTLRRHARCQQARWGRAGPGPDRAASGPWLLRPAMLVATRRARQGLVPALQGQPPKPSGRGICPVCHICQVCQVSQSWAGVEPAALPGVSSTLPRRPACPRVWRARTGRPRPRPLHPRAR